MTVVADDGCRLWSRVTGLDGSPPSYRPRAAEILAAEPNDDDWLARVSTGFEDRASALGLAERLMTPRFTPALGFLTAG